MLKPHLLCKHREIRDIYKKLRAKYRRDTIMTFVGANYFITPPGIERVLHFADKEPVDLETASIIYKRVMSEDFYL